MKMQRHWGWLFIVLLFVAWLAPMQMVIAEQEKPDKMKQKGLILLDFPSPLKAKVEVNLNTKLINLVTKSVSNQPEVAELIQMLDGIYVRTYDRLSGIRMDITISETNSKRINGKFSSKSRKIVK